MISSGYLFPFNFTQKTWTIIRRTCTPQAKLVHKELQLRSFMGQSEGRTPPNSGQKAPLPRGLMGGSLEQWKQSVGEF